MSTRTHPIDERLSEYLHALAVLREDPLLVELRAVAALPMARMQISVEQGDIEILLGHGTLPVGATVMQHDPLAACASSGCSDLSIQDSEPARAATPGDSR